jgi:hypothetical protein
MPTKKATKKVKPATPADAEIAMRLYDLRRESEMRKARNFVNFEFWPANFEDFSAVASAMDRQENAYLRQVQSYWEMAASLVLHGTLHPGVFLDWCGEAFFTYAKFKPLLKEIRAKMGPAAFANIEALTAQYPEMRERVKMLEQRIAQRFRASGPAAGKQ